MNTNSATGTASARASPPRLRVARATSAAAGIKNSASHPTRLSGWWWARWPSSCAVTTRTSRRLKRPSSNVSHRSTRRVGPSPTDSALGAVVKRPTSWTKTRVPGSPSARASARASARTAGSRSGCVFGTRYGPANVDSSARPTNTGEASAHHQRRVRPATPIATATASDTNRNVPPSPMKLSISAATYPWWET